MCFHGIDTGPPRPFRNPQPEGADPLKPTETEVTKILRHVLSTALALWLSSGALWAQDFQARMIAQLQAQGFTHFEVSQTWLGRVRIEAQGPGIEREIIFNRRTGEILRDYWEVEENYRGGGGAGLPSPAGALTEEELEELQEAMEEAAEEAEEEAEEQEEEDPEEEEEPEEPEEPEEEEEEENEEE